MASEYFEPPPFPSGARKEASVALAEQKNDYFVHDMTLSVPQMVALQATDDFRLLR